MCFRRYTCFVFLSLRSILVVVHALLFWGFHWGRHIWCQVDISSIYDDQQVRTTISPYQVLQLAQKHLHSQCHNFVCRCSLATNLTLYRSTSPFAVRLILYIHLTSIAFWFGGSVVNAYVSFFWMAWISSTIVDHQQSSSATSWKVRDSWSTYRQKISLSIFCLLIDFHKTSNLGSTLFCGGSISTVSHRGWTSPMWYWWCGGLRRWCGVWWNFGWDFFRLLQHVLLFCNLFTFPTLCSFFIEDNISTNH